MKLLLFMLSLSAVAQVRLDLVAITTNQPAFDFSAATPLGSYPATYYFHDRKFCQSATFTVTGEPGVYDLQWNYALGNPQTNGNTIEGHAFVNVYPPITNTTGTVTVTYPAKPSPASFWRLKQRVEYSVITGGNSGRVFP